MKRYHVKTLYHSAIVDVDDGGVIVTIAPIWAMWRGKTWKGFINAHRYYNIVWSEINETKD